MRYVAASLAVFVAAPVALWAGQALTIALLGQAWFLLWAVPFAFCIYKSFR